jgi:hypothetical protein
LTNSLNYLPPMLNTSDLIKQEISRLELHGSSNWLSLYRQVNDNYRPIKWNLAQMQSQLATNHFNVIYDEWGRGSGKTQNLTKKMKESAETMPRGLGLFVVPTYTLYSTEIYSSLVTGFEMNGWFEGLHYWVGKEPPKNWNIPYPYKRMKDYSRTLFTWTGFVYIIASQDANNAGVGTSVDVNLSDESALLGWKYMSTVIFPTVRGSGNREVQKDFKKRSKYFTKHFFHSSTPMLPHGQELLYGLENGSYSEDLKKLGIGGVCVVKANYKFNKQNLAENYAETQRILIPDTVTFNAQVENIRPPSVSGGYYVGLNKDIHGYLPLDNGVYTPDCRADSDLIKGKRLILGIDWGDVINSCVVNQLNGKEVRALKALFVLGDHNQTQDDLAENFAKYYQYHDCDEVELWYDKTGNVRIGNSRKTRAQQFADVLRKHKFKVILKTKGMRNVSHDKKKTLWENILREGKDAFGRDRHDPRFPYFRMNLINCAPLWTSMANSPAKSGREGETIKDKGSERRSSNVLPQHATHLGDAEDSPVYGMFAGLLRSLGINVPEDEA